MRNINVTFIILEVTASTKTKENREVFSFKVADQTACINCSIWDEPGKLLQPGDIVRMMKCYASMWRGCLTLYSGKNGEIARMGNLSLHKLVKFLILFSFQFFLRRFLYDIQRATQHERARAEGSQRNAPNRDEQRNERKRQIPKCGHCFPAGGAFKHYSQQSQQLHRPSSRADQAKSQQQHQKLCSQQTAQ